MWRCIWVGLGMLIATPLVAVSWDAHGHRVITYLALDGLSADMPAWLKEEAVRHRIAEQSNAPDRWKGWNSDTLRHLSYPDHFLDIELLEEFGLTLETMPRLRREYLRAMAISKHLHPEKVSPHDPTRDTARAHEWPGFAMHAMEENYTKLQSVFLQIRILESLNEPGRKHQYELLKNNAIFHMGMLSHFVGDICQPLHTTKHYNGWVGDNPKGYTTANTIHAAMDGAPNTHELTHAKLEPHAKYDTKVNGADVWEDLHTYINRSFAHVETVYQLDKDGALGEEKGREFIIERVTDGSAMLAAMYNAAWESAKPTEAQIASFVKYNDYYAERDMTPATPE